MKKIFCVFSLLIFLAVPAMASGRYEKTVSDCNPAAMRAELDRAVRRHRAVITVVKCRAAIPNDKNGGRNGRKR